MKRALHHIIIGIIASTIIMSCSYIKREEEKRKEEFDKSNKLEISKFMQLSEKAKVGKLNSKEAFELGGCYANGDGVKVDIDEAFKWYGHALEIDDDRTGNCNMIKDKSEDGALLPKQQRRWRLLYERYCKE